eukprot:4931954-Lingulodinium_polyedra.AAC.1
MHPVLGCLGLDVSQCVPDLTVWPPVLAFLGIAPEDRQELAVLAHVAGRIVPFNAAEDAGTDE